ncbi:MAG TPA: cyclophane-forming radical SAM/SPASM peptide maturase GrrM/OscB [Terrimicrobiaceae bacterium]
MSIQRVIMQPTSFCNLDCSYCYVPDRLVKGSMTTDTLAHFFRVLFSSDVSEECRIVWHSGEPLVAGTAFYRQMFAIQRRYNQGGRRIAHGIQTNGTLINEDWCALFKEFDISIGISLDGPAFMHDRHRVDRSGRGSFHQVIRAINLLRQWEIPHNVLSVLTRESLDYPEEYFDFLVENNIACSGFNIEETNVQTKRSSMVTKEEPSRRDLTSRYKHFVATLFELWKQHYRTIEIRELSQMYHIVNEKSKNPAFRRTSQEQFGMEVLNIKKNGDVSTFSPELIEGNDGDRDAFVLGNVSQLTCFEELLATPKYKTIDAEVQAGIEKCQKRCVYFDFCGGGHLSAKYFEHGTFDCTETEFCKLHRQALVDVVIDNLSLPKAYDR